MANDTVAPEAVATSGDREIEVAQWGRAVIVLHNSSYSENPFTIELDAVFTHTDTGTELALPGYYSGEDAWNIAFMPTLEGEWRYITRSADSDLDDKTGTVLATAPRHRGLLGPDPVNPNKWRFANGDYVVPIGVFVQIMLEDATEEEFLSLAMFLREHNIDLINFRLSENDKAFSDVEALRMDLVAWERLESRMDILRDHGVGVDIMLYTDDSGQPSYEEQSPAERLLIRYMVARLCPYPGVLFNSGIDIWEYRGANWHDWYEQEVRSLDPYGHPVSSRQPPGRPEGFPSTNKTYHSVGERNSTISWLLDAYDRFEMPACNNDNWGEQREGINGHTIEDIRRAAWKALISGGVAFHVRHNVVSCPGGTDECDMPFTIPGIEEELDSEEWIALVPQFVQDVLGRSFGVMVPDAMLVSGTGAYALADADRDMIVCLLIGVNDTWDAGGGDVTLRLSNTSGTFAFNWYDPRTGNETRAGWLESGRDHVLPPPSQDDWLIILSREERAACCREGACRMQRRLECETDCVRSPPWQCDGDVDGDGQVDPVDAAIVRAHFGSEKNPDRCNYDIDCDGRVNPVDAGIVESLFGRCIPVRPVCNSGAWFGGEDCQDFECR